MALGNIAPGNDVVRLNLLLQPVATEAYTVPGVKYNLLSMNQLVADNYITIFSNDTVSIYDANNTEVSVLRQAILEGWHVKRKGFGKYHW